ncbi:S-layer homology domain-containing protein [Pseudomonadota bacterium]
MTRGEGIDIIINSFNLQETKQSFIRACLENVHDCFFVFSAMSDFDGITLSDSLKELTLYPDVHNRLKHYNSICIASMLGLVHGYLNEEQTPFRPEAAITRIQALKVTLGAAELLSWQEKFELDGPQITSFEDSVLSNESTWWYPRYLNFALDEDIVSEEVYFRPDDPITERELMKIIERTEKAQSRIASQNYDPQIISFTDPAE